MSTVNNKGRFRMAVAASINRVPSTYARSIFRWLRSGAALPSIAVLLRFAGSPFELVRRRLSINRRIAVPGLAIIISLIQVFLLGWQISADSPTWDEVAHFAAGLVSWRYARFDVYCVNPPLVRIIALSPEACLYGGRGPSAEYLNGSEPDSRPEFAAGKAVADAMGASYFRHMALARWACVPFCILGAWICYRWATELWGVASGIIALALWSFSPSVLAYGHLITPDLGATSLSLAAMYMIRRWLKTPTWTNTLAAGAVVGLACLAKFTCIIFVTLWPISWAIWRATDRESVRLCDFGADAARLFVAVLVALLVLNLGFNFEGSFKPLRDYVFVSSALRGRANIVNSHNVVAGNRFAKEWFGSIRVPVPENYLRGIDLQKLDFERGLWSYLNGRWRHGGWWYYYLYAMLIKEPLGTWVLAALALGLALSRKCYSAPLQEEIILLLPAVSIILLVSSQTGFNHHLRYVLPAFPFVFISISRIGRAISLRHIWIGVIAGAALAWSIGSSLYVFPHSLSYFNELAGGPTNGHWRLGNSNADWGQDLLYLKYWLDHHPEVTPLHLEYDNPLIDPGLAGINFEPVPVRPRSLNASRHGADRAVLRAGWYAISVNKLHDREHNYEYFLHFKPVAVVGYTIYIYNLSVSDVARVQNDSDARNMQKTCAFRQHRVHSARAVCEGAMGALVGDWARESTFHASGRN